ncbi:MAG: acyloxyacyl hydrolase [Saccharospirillum sp.]
MKRLALFLCIASAAITANAQVKMYNLAVGTSIGSALIVNAPRASQAGFDAGWGEGKDRGRLLLVWDLPIQAEYGPLFMQSGLELALGQTNYEDEQQAIINATPLFNWYWPLGPVEGVFETGLGVAWVSATELGPFQYSTPFQFSQIFGLGLKWQDWQLGWRYQHVSNGDIEKPNNGQDFYGVMLKYHY